MRRQAVVFVVVAAGYAVGSELSFSWFGASSPGPSFFPAAGVSLAALVLLERRLWPVVVAAVALSEFTVDLGHDIAPLPAAGYVVANVAQALLGAWSLTSVRPRVDLARMGDLVAFLACAVVAAPAVGGALGATTFVALDDGSGWARFAAQWWVGDGLGVLVIAGAVLAFGSSVARGPHGPRLLEALGLGAASIASTIVLFWVGWPGLAYVPAALLIVAGFRVGTRAVALTGAAVAFVAAQATANGHTFWESVEVSPSTALLYLQLALGLVLIGALAIAAEITERERAAIGWASAERFRELADAAPAMIWVTDVDGECIFLSRGWYERTGVPKDAGLAAAWTEVIHPDDREASAATFLGAAKRRAPFALDYRLRHADGSYRWAIDLGRPRFDPDGRFLGYVGSVIDVHERKRAEDALRLAADRDRFRAALTDALRPIADPLEVQAEAARMLGEHLGTTRASFAEVEPDGEHLVIHRDFTAGVPSAVGRHGLDDYGGEVAEALRAGRTLAVEDVAADASLTASQRAAFAAVAVGAHLLVPLVRGGRPIALLGVAQDAPRAWTDDEVALVEEVAERTWAAAQRARSEKALRESEERFRRLADNAPDLIWMNDAANRGEFMNAAYVEFLGRPLEELTGRGWVESVHPDDAEHYVEAYLQATARRERFEAEFRFRRHDGVYRWMRSVGVPRFEGGVYAGYVGSTSDIHEARLDRDREALMALVAHELDQEVGVDERLGRLVRLLVARGVGDACRVSRVAGAGALAPGPHAAAGAEGERLLDDLEEGSPAVLEVARGGAPLLVPDAPAPTALVPLSARGRTLGVLAVARARGPAYAERDLATLRQIGQRAGLAIDNAALYEAEVLARDQAERARRRVAELHALAAVLSNAVSLYDVARAGADAIMTAAGADAVWLVVEAEEPGRLRTARVTGYPARVERRFAAFPRDAALPVAVAARDGRPLFFEDGRALLDRYPLMAEVRADAGAACAVPVGSGALGLAYDTARAFDDAERAHLVAMGRLVGQALARAERFEHEREVSALLQRSLLPSRLPHVSGLSIARDYQPGAAGTEAGGDWYDALVLADGRVAITVGDVVGRGPRAATVMGQMRSALSAYLTAGSAPALALAQLNEFAVHVDGASGATALCLIVDPDDGRVVWARAGHPPPLVVGIADAGYRETLRGPLLGLLGDAVYEEGRFTLAAGAAVLAYSDGLIERRGGELDRSLAALAAIAGGAPRWSAEQLLHAIRVAALPQGGVDDDVVMVVVARHLEPRAISTDAVPANLRAVRHSLRDWIAPWALPAAEVDDMVLALGEAIANAAEHAYSDGEPGPLEARFSHDPDGEVVMLVSDAGRWRRLPDGADRGHRGHGLDLMRAVMDRVDVVPSSTGTRVELRYRPRPSPAEPGLGIASAPSQPDAAGVEVDPERDGGEPIHVRVRGEIDETSAASLADAVLPRLSLGRALVIDLSRTVYIGSAAVHVIGDAMRRAAAGNVDLSVRVAAGSAPHRVLVLTDLADRVGVSIAAPPAAGAAEHPVQAPEVTEADKAHDG